MILFFDTETTGKADFRAPASDPRQPRIVQLGAILQDFAGWTVGEINLLVKPDGWTIPAEATAIHGITTERCERYGLRAATVVRLFLALAGRAETIVAHNLDFDRLMVLIELARLEGMAAEAEAMAVRAGYCTMREATGPCRLPGKWGRDYKWPSLQEAHRIFFKEEFAGAHDAMADVRACARVYWHLQTLKHAGGAA